MSHVLAFEATALDTLGRFQGYTRDVQRYLSVILDPDGVRFISRELAERSPSFKQIIPYVVLICGDVVYSYLRGSRGAEGRLTGLRSIGLGGHIEPGDMSAGTTGFYQAAVRREIAEEVLIETTYEEVIVAAINDDSNEVGRVHFGILHLWQLADTRVKAIDKAVAEGAFWRLAALLAASATLESWSQIALRAVVDWRSRMR